MAAFQIAQGALVGAVGGLDGYVRNLVLDPVSDDVADVGEGSGRRWLVPARAIETVGGDRAQFRGRCAELWGVREFGANVYEAVDAVSVPSQRHADESPAVAAVISTQADASQDLRTASVVALAPYRLQRRLGSSHRLIERTETVIMSVREEPLIIELLPGAGSFWVGDRELREDEWLELTLMRERLVVKTEVVVQEGAVLRVEAAERREDLQAVLREEQLDVRTSGSLDVERQGSQGAEAPSTTAGQFIPPARDAARFQQPTGKLAPQPCCAPS